MSDEAIAEASGAEAPAPAPKPAKPAKAQAKKGKAEAKGGKEGGKKSKGKKGQADTSGSLSVATHPRASASVRQLKGWGGLLAFGVAAYLSLSHGATPDVAGLRALIAGVCGYVVSWACAVIVWRQLMVADLRARVEAARPKSAPFEPPAEPTAPAPGQP